MSIMLCLAAGSSIQFAILCASSARRRQCAGSSRWADFSIYINIPAAFRVSAVTRCLLKVRPKLRLGPGEAGMRVGGCLIAGCASSTSEQRKLRRPQAAISLIVHPAVVSQQAGTEPDCFAFLVASGNAEAADGVHSLFPKAEALG